MFKTLEKLEISEKNKIQKEKDLNLLIKNHKKLIECTAAKIYETHMIPVGVEFKDLVSWGVEGLLDAHQKYNSNKNVKLSTYAIFRVRGAILDELRKEWRHFQIRENNKIIKNNLSTPLKDGIDTDINKKDETKTKQKLRFTSWQSNVDQIASTSKYMNNPEKDYIDENYDDLWKQVQTLEASEKDVIYCIYRKEMRVEDISKLLGYSIAKISRLKKSAILKLQRRLNDLV